MGRTKKSSEELNYTILNRTISNIGDLAADLSLVYREQAHLIQLQMEQQIAREKDLKELTEKFVNLHGPKIAQELTKEIKDDNNSGTELRPANFSQIFGKNPDGK